MWTDLIGQGYVPDSLMAAALVVEFLDLLKISMAGSLVMS